MTMTTGASARFHFRFAERFNGEGSPVRDMMDLVGGPDMISFGGGVPDENLFAVDDLRRAFDAVLTREPRRALQYASTEGEPELRELAAERLTRHLPTSADQVQVTSGAQEAIHLATEVFVDDGRVVLVERPTYLAAIQAFQMAGAHVIAIPGDEDGIDPAALESLIATYDPAFVYLVPTFQNPSGTCMPLDRRLAVADVLLRTATLLIEDDPYGELRYDGDPIPPIAALPGMAPQTLLLNSLSKVMSPGMRVGWVRGDHAALRALAVAKQATGLQSAVTDQLAAAYYLGNCDLDAHIRSVSGVYRSRRDAMYEALVEALPYGSDISRPDGGMFLWVRMACGIDTLELMPEALERGVAIVPGGPFYATDPDPATMRLSFVTNAPATIREGVSRLRQAVDAVLRVA